MTRPPMLARYLKSLELVIVLLAAVSELVRCMGCTQGGMPVRRTADQYIRWVL